MNTLLILVFGFTFEGKASSCLNLEVFCIQYSSMHSQHWASHVKTNEPIFFRNGVYIEADRKSYILKYGVGDYAFKCSRQSYILMFKSH